MIRRRRLERDEAVTVVEGGVVHNAKGHAAATEARACNLQMK